MRKGFTLIEVIVVLMIIFLFVSVAISALSKGKTGYRVTRIDGCEYIESGIYDNFTRTHKGNCDNPIHYNSKLEK